MTNTVTEAMALKIVASLRGLTLKESDMILDAARRLHWMIGFSGCSREAAEREHGSSDGALTIAALLDGMSVCEAGDIITEARYRVWTAHWSTIKGSAFALLLEAKAERMRQRHVAAPFGVGVVSAGKADGKRSHGERRQIAPKLRI